MYNSNSFIMRDQVSDVVKSVMEDSKTKIFARKFNQISIAATAIVTCSLFLV